MSAPHAASGRTLAGYRDRLSVRPGDTLRFMVSSFDAQPYRADLVRIRSGNTQAAYAGLELDLVDAPFAGEYPGFDQLVQCGSCGVVEDERALVAADEGFSLACAVQPWTRDRASVALFALSDLERGGQLVLGIDARGRLSLRHLAGDGSLRAEARVTRPLPLRRWSLVGACVEPDRRRLRLFQTPRSEGSSDPAALAAADVRRDDLDLRTGALGRPTFAARWNPRPGGLRTLEHLNGRLDSPRLFRDARPREPLAESVERAVPPASDAAIAGWWDFADDMGGASFGDRSPQGLRGYFRNLPTRAVRGLRWSGRETCWRHAPDEYSAVHFHEYDLYDAEWDASFAYSVPDDLPSGIYAARLKKRDETEYLTFFVLPARDGHKADAAFLASTATYLAYANETLALPLAGLVKPKPPILPEERLLLERPEYGPSTYHHHLDGSGVHFSSYLRPTTNWRPGGRVWCLNADFDVIRWLASTQTAFDVITDEALHREGASLLADYRVVVTGTHPEYTSEPMRGALEGFLSRGGRLMYLGGNGFYWKIAHSEAWPAALELRRAEDGTRAWVSPPGEYHHQFDGRLGGLWLRSGAAPQQLVGVGFAAQGTPGALRFRRQPGADDPRAAFLMRGVDEEVICDFRRMQASCSVEEVDRADPSLGTPAHALVVASSEKSRADLIRSKEELLIELPWIPDPDVRADVTFFETAGGGAVFSTGSIGWSSVLAYADYRNPAARLTENALLRFLDPEPFALPLAGDDPEALNPLVRDPPPGLRLRALPWREVLSGALTRAAVVLVTSALIKVRGLLLQPVPPPRDRRDPEKPRRPPGAGA